MLALMIRRLSLTALLMASLVGTGLLFGSAGTIQSAEANVLETGDIVVEIAAEAASEGVPPESRPVPAHAARGADLRWPFFTFGRKRSGPSW